MGRGVEEVEKFIASRANRRPLEQEIVRCRVCASRRLYRVHEEERAAVSRPFSAYKVRSDIDRRYTEVRVRGCE